MTGLIIAATLEAVFILALMARVYVVESKLNEMVDALNNHASLLDNHTESIEGCYENDEQIAATLEDLMTRTKWIDDIDKLSYEAEV